MLRDCTTPCAPRRLGPAVQTLPLMIPLLFKCQAHRGVTLRCAASRQSLSRGVGWLLLPSDLGLIFSTPLVLALTYVQTGHRCNAPFTPKVLLCGPLGSGKKLQAALLAQKYGLVNSKYLTKRAACCLLPAQALCVPS